MVARLSLVDTLDGTEIRVVHCEHNYVRQFRLRESAIACLMANGYVSSLGSSQHHEILSPIGLEIETTSELLLHQGYVRAD